MPMTYSFWSMPSPSVSISTSWLKSSRSISSSSFFSFFMSAETDERLPIATDATSTENRMYTIEKTCDLGVR